MSEDPWHGTDSCLPRQACQPCVRTTVGGLVDYIKVAGRCIHLTDRRP